MRGLPLAFSCGEDWDAMRGDSRERFCVSCSRAVHDLSAGNETETEARARLIVFGSTGFCARFEADRHGNIVFAREVRRAMELFVRVPRGASQSTGADRFGTSGER